MLTTDHISTRSCAIYLACPQCGETCDLRYKWGHCSDCGTCLDVVYDYERATDLIHSIDMAERVRDVWRFEELLPTRYFESQRGAGNDIGNTPLVHAKRLGDELGLSQLYIKNDSVAQPSFSYKDRVVAMAIARALDLEEDTIACVSTGNVGNAVAAMAARAGLKAIVFYPSNIEHTKALISASYGATVVQVDANYDETNALCREIAERTGLVFANINLRPFYSEGAKTVAFEIVEQLGWQAPDHILLPAAGGTLTSRVYKGLRELARVSLAETKHTALSIAQPAGCQPIARAVRRGDSFLLQEIPATMAYSLAIGNPGDGMMVVDAVKQTGGSSATPTDAEIFEAIDLLARTEGILTEPAGGTVIAGLSDFAHNGFFGPDQTVVAVITGNGLKTLADTQEMVSSWPMISPTLREMAMQIEGSKWDA